MEHFWPCQELVEALQAKLPTNQVLVWDVPVDPFSRLVERIWTT